MSETTKYAPLGSVSSGTMRPEDLIPAFLDALDDCKQNLSLSVRNGEEAEITVEVGRLDDLMGAIEQRMERDDYYDSDDCGYDLEELFSELEAFAPPYAYFGAHEGDGADYGFWISWESLEDDCRGRAPSVLKIDAGDEWPDPLPEGTEYVLEVTDHGNAALYTPDHAEVWSVV